MALFFEVMEGDEAKGQHKIREGLEIGRTMGDILLNDPKVSSSHATVKKDENRGHFILIDKGSANGIRLNNRRIQRALLLPGVSIQIGKTTLRVVDQEEEVFFRPSDWKEQLRRLLNGRLQEEEEFERQQLSAFSKVVRLRFTQGIQLDTVWEVGYGPRMIGKQSLDLTVYDRDAPEICFQIHPDGEKVKFITPEPEKVKVNNRKHSETHLRTGDTISFATTKILVELSR